MKQAEPNCILCGSSDTGFLLRDDTRRNNTRDYYSCSYCALIFVSPGHRLGADEEFQRYELHENDPDDPRYRKFLRGMYGAMLQRIGPESHGLDFGSGPGPALGIMFREAGHSVRLYDVFYANDPSVFDQKYDFITTTETVEHLFEPLKELDRLYSCLRRDGWLGIMTQLVDYTESFRNWHYKNDDTHVAFFSKRTFEWLREYWGAELKFWRDDIMLFRKK